MAASNQGTNWRETTMRMATIREMWALYGGPKRVRLFRVACPLATKIKCSRNADVWMRVSKRPLPLLNACSKTVSRFAIGQLLQSDILADCVSAISAQYGDPSSWSTCKCMPECYQETYTLVSTRAALPFKVHWLQYCRLMAHFSASQMYQCHWWLSRWRHRIGFPVNHLRGISGKWSVCWGGEVAGQ